jgi:hypothetical protein
MRMMAKAAVAAAFLYSMTFGAAAHYYVPGWLRLLRFWTVSA